MKSVILCEGPDDLWFISYYLHKTEQWNESRNPEAIWRNYLIARLNEKQQVVYLSKGTNSVAIWCVAGKDSFEQAIKVLFDKLIRDYPSDPIDSIVLLRDRDQDDISEILKTLENWLPTEAFLENKKTSSLSFQIDGEVVSTKITPVLIPFDEEGAIETILMKSISESDREGSAIVAGAKEYISKLLSSGNVGQTYLNHDRLVLKAKYDATIAATNPGHSTGLFQDMVMSCPWEESPYVREHFSVVADAIKE